ncbi:E3 ubiquitin-protein ligase RNF31 isoform X2 [Centropristis striata]|uniref:E3 ubiquitin-protein ligase RNF31 isoform X2 n=1 Tax=Centropristis striata TaxID=184440 RepID=UPI0027E1D945|nr:E3 ubiquitin-protein ligase RNF31 isoform X2 [Centropristis striata]
MPRVGAEAELRTLTQCQYSYPVETLCDLQEVRSVFPDLRLYVDFYCFPNKEKKKLVYLAGTLPVHYEGSDYNIPVCIWLHETHPVSRPRCFVCPSVSMVINPSCSCVDASGNIDLDALKNWTHGVSNLSLLVSEMRQAFRRDTPLYARCPVQAPPPASLQVSAGSNHHSTSSSIASSSITSSSSTSSFSTSSFSTSPSPQSIRLYLTSSHLSGQKGSQWDQSGQVRRSYTEELLGIDFSAPSPSSNNPFLNSASTSGVPPADSLSRRMGALRLDGKSSRDQQGESPLRTVQSQAARGRHTTDSVVLVPGSAPAAGLQQDPGAQRLQSEPAAGLEHIKMASCLPPDQAATFLSLVTMEGRGFSPDDVMEAVQLTADFPSALKFLTHRCPICQDQVTFSKILQMTHCSCFLCLTCFKSFFSAAIKERSIDQLVCPQCGCPEVKGQAGMDYFNLLDTQIRHFLHPEIHELFQRKLRDRALQDMPSFRWCAHCSFGMLHEADRLRMDCPSCKKSTCCQCRSPWSPQHQGLSCKQFRVLQQQNHPDQQTASLLHHDSIECPQCQSVFSLSRGGCLHFTCTQCLHQFCGGCSRPFTPGSVCGFSADCGSKGLHAHHPRDCLYHLRDWSVPRLHLLLQYYRVSPTWLEPATGSSPEAGQTVVCSILELRDDGGRQEEPCGRPAAPEYRGYCQTHYKERLVELINRCHADPAAIFSAAEIAAELQRWNIPTPSRKPEETEPLYTQRLLQKQQRDNL